MVKPPAPANRSSPRRRSGAKCCARTREGQALELLRRRREPLAARLGQQLVQRWESSLALHRDLLGLGYQIVEVEHAPILTGVDRAHRPRYAEGCTRPPGPSVDPTQSLPVT
jgi:hypothetical protein